MQTSTDARASPLGDLPDALLVSVLEKACRCERSAPRPSDPGGADTASDDAEALHGRQAVTVLAHLLCKRTKALYPSLAPLDHPIDLRRPLPRCIVAVAFRLLSGDALCSRKHLLLTEHGDVLAALVQSGVADNVRWWHGKCRIARASVEPCRAAAATGDLDMLQWLHEHGSPLPMGICEAAAAGGNVLVLRYAHAHMHTGDNLDARVCEAAAGGGHLDALRWLREEQQCPWDEKTCVRAATGGHVAVLRWAAENGCPLSLDAVAELVRRGSDMDTVRWAQARAAGCTWTSLVAAAAEGGLMEILELADADVHAHAHPQGFGGWMWHMAGCVEAAARRGDLHMVRWLCERGTSVWSPDMVQVAAAGGHTAVVEYLHQRKCPWGPETVAAAAGGGHMDTLVWLRAHGGTWATGVANAAAAGGHLAILQWLRQEGCPWHNSTCTAAVIGGHVEVLVWAIKHMCPYDQFKWWCRIAAVHGHIRMLKWLRARGCPWDDLTWDAAQMQGGPVWQYVVANGCPSPPKRRPVPRGEWRLGKDCQGRDLWQLVQVGAEEAADDADADADADADVADEDGDEHGSGSR